MRRRTFLTTTSRATAGAWLAAHGMRLPGHAQGITPSGRLAHLLPESMLSSSLRACDVLPEPTAALDLQRLATTAIEAAHHAGAAYADVRVAERHLCNVGAGLSVRMTSTLTYGIRVLVDGVWANVHGNVPTTDAVATSAQNAVAMANGYAPLVVRRVELVPAPVVRGEWRTPMQEDPFAVPLREQGALLSVLGATVGGRVANLGVSREVDWIRETRVFASSEGTLVTQYLSRAHPQFRASITRFPFGRVNLRFLPMRAAVGGFECLANPMQYETTFLAFVEDIERYLLLPRCTLDVGRYPVVMDGASAGLMLGSTLGQALELDRVLGEDAGASGTSYLAPPLELLGTPIASPKLTMMAANDASAPSSVRWDDEGVETHPYPVVTEGRLVDYHTSRWTSSALRAWYEKQGQPLRSHGGAVAAAASDIVNVRTPHVRVMPNTASASIDTLCKELGEGLLVVGISDYAIDQQLSSGMLSAPRAELPTGVILKVVRGQIVGRVQGNGMEMGMKHFWKEQLIGVGDASTAQFVDFEATKGMPWQSRQQSLETPAMLFKNVNVTAYRKDT